MLSVTRFSNSPALHGLLSLFVALHAGGVLVKRSLDLRGIGRRFVSILWLLSFTLLASRCFKAILPLSTAVESVESTFLSCGYPSSSFRKVVNGFRMYSLRLSLTSTGTG